MDALTLLVPAVATVALGGALLVPIRDARAGRKATLNGRSPLFADFRKLSPVAGDPVSPAGLCESPHKFERSAQEDIPLVELPTAAEPLPAQAFAARNGASTLDAFAFFRIVSRRLRSRQPAAATEADVVTERSFADELASLLPVATEATDTPCESTFASELVEVSAPNQPDASLEAPPAKGAEPARVSLDHAVTETNEQTHDVRAKTIGSPRVVPLTRLPLRHVSKDVTWPALASPPQAFATHFERYAFLRTGARGETPVEDSVFALAFREETPEGRALALAALRRTDASKEAIEVFAEALGTGSDEERAIAVDALSEAGARDEIARGVTDRIDAIAAKAALAFVGTTARDDYRAALSPLVDQTRIETILALLAGVVE